MARVDNDATKGLAQPFLILAQKRSGGTFLAHCLSSHLDVFCDRGETLHHLGVWRRRMAIPDLIYAMMHQEGYLASGFRAVYGQGLHRNVWPQILAQEAKIIWLTRENKLRQAASTTVHKAIRAGKLPYYPVHTFETASKRPVPQYSVKPESILKEARLIRQQDERWAGRRLKGCGLKGFRLQYHQLTGGEGITRTAIVKPIAEKLCKFLGVPYAPLRTRLKRVHQHPLRAMFANWGQIEAAVKDSEFAKFLAVEEQWIQKGSKWTVEG